ncbi:MAG: hypothetical protein KF816_11625 [Melioribacteraceae bacterium]|nr:hypothetical protein [Melioribacteraceae bacterium]
MENKSDSWLPSLLKKIKPLPPHEVVNYTKINPLRIDLFSKNAVFLVFTIKKNIQHERWIPYSQLRKGIYNNIWLSKWLIQNLKLHEENKYPPQETSGEIICGDPTEGYNY